MGRWTIICSLASIALAFSLAFLMPPWLWTTHWTWAWFGFCLLLGVAGQQLGAELDYRREARERSRALLALFDAEVVTWRDR
jgi:hypothetical protein